MAPSQSTTRAHSLPWVAGLVLAAFVFLTRMPFVWSGFGTDSDTWKLAWAVRETLRTGLYTASRLPGYPLMEWICTPLAPLGAWAPNMLSALAAAACAWLSARLFARHGVRDAALAGAAVVFVPAAYIASTSSIDYLFAIAFLLAAWLDAAEGRAWRAGIWLGLAVGVRITSCLFVLPLALLAWQAAARREPRRAIVLAALGSLIGTLFYIPGFLRYGWTMLSYSDIQGGQSSALHLLTGIVHPGDTRIPLPLVLGQATALLWGVVGCVAIALALLARFRPSADDERGAHIARHEAQAMALAVGLVVCLYLRLPHDEGYLLPAVPLVVLALAAWSTPMRFRAVCAALLVSPFLFGIDASPPKKGLTPTRTSPYAFSVPLGRETIIVEPFRGPVLRDLAKRQRMMEVARALEAWWPGRPAETRIASGNMMSVLYYLFPMDPRKAPFTRDVTAVEQADALARGAPILVLPDVVPRMRISQGLTSTAGLQPLAGSEADFR